MSTIPLCVEEGAEGVPTYWGFYGGVSEPHSLLREILHSSMWYSTQGVCPSNARVTSTLAVAAESVRLVSTTALLTTQDLKGKQN